MMTRPFRSLSAALLLASCCVHGTAAEEIVISDEVQLVSGAMKPVYKVADDTVHMIYTKGDAGVYYRRLTTSGEKIGNEEKVSGISWITSGFNADKQSSGLAYRNGKLVVASGDNSGFMGIAVKKGGSWVHTANIDEATKKGGRYKRIVDPDVAIQGDGTVHIAYQRYGHVEEVHTVLDANTHEVTKQDVIHSGQGEHCVRRLLVTDDNTLHLAYVKHIHEVYYRQFDGSWTDAMNLKTEGGYTGQCDMSIRGNTAYVIFSQGPVDHQRIVMSKVNIQTRGKELMEVADEEEELYSQSIGVDKDNGTIHATYWIREYPFKPAELLYIFSRDEGSSWSSPEKITEKGGNYSRSWLTCVGNGKTIIIYSDQRNNIYLRTFTEAGGTVSDRKSVARKPHSNRGITVRKPEGAVVIDPGTTDGIREITICDAFGKVVHTYHDVTGPRHISVNRNGVFFVTVRLEGKTGAAGGRIAILNR